MSSLSMFSVASVSHELRIALEYREGRPLTDNEIRTVLSRDAEAHVQELAALGRWLRALDKLGAHARPRLHGKPQNNPSEAQRKRRSEQSRDFWARRRLKESA